MKPKWDASKPAHEPFNAPDENFKWNPKDTTNETIFFGESLKETRNKQQMKG